MRVAVFLTCERAAAGELLLRVRERWPGAALVAFANDEDRAALARAHAGVEFRRDKPPGGRAAFVRTLRAERFDHVVVAWHGGERFLPLRVAALLLGAPVTAADEKGRESAVAALRPWTWLPHATRRAARTGALQYARIAAGCYRWTVGLLVAALVLPLRAALARAGRR